MVAELKKQTLPTETSEHVLLQGITWATFEALVQDLETQPSKRLTYDNGTLEIWMPLALHERYKKFLARLIEIVTLELDIEICSLGSCTWRRSDLAKGVEADECYYIQNEPIIQNRMEINLAVDPPPDLAIEIDITSLSLSRLSIYKALRVPEVWRFDGTELTFLQLTGDDYESASYESIPQSIALPIMTVEETTMLIKKTQEIRETSWAKFVRNWIQSQREKQS